MGVPRALLGIVTGVPRVLLRTIMDGCASYTLHEFDDLRGAQLIQTLLILPVPHHTHTFFVSLVLPDFLPILSHKGAF